MIQRVDWHDHAAIKAVAEKIKNGAVVAGTSDTVLGLLAKASHAGKNELDRIKQRSGMPYLVLVPSFQAARTLSPVLQLGPVAQMAQAFWPGPLTLIVPAGKDVPDYLQSPTGGIAVRVPDHAGLQELLSECGMLFSTSANLSGHPVPERFSDIDPAIAGQMAYLVGPQQDSTVIPSTILDCTQAKIKIIREGAISKELLKTFI